MHYGRFLRGVDTGFNGVKDCYLGLRHFIALLLSCGFVVIGCGGRGGGSGGGALEVVFIHKCKVLVCVQTVILMSLGYVQNVQNLQCDRL